MENITLGQIRDVVLFIVALAGGIATLYKLLMTGFEKKLEPLRKEFTSQINSIKKEMQDNNFDSIKGDLVSLMCLAENGVISEEQKKLAHERFDVYTKPPYNGNSYVKEKFESLHKEEKI